MRVAGRILLIAAVLCSAVGCPRSGRRTIPDVPTDGDAQARDRFQQARSTFERDSSGGKAGVSEFESIARDYPDDPIVPYALLYAGMTAVRAGDYRSAIDNLRELGGQKSDESLLRRGRFFLGLAYSYSGQHREAIEPLTNGRKSVADDSEEIEWLGAMAESHAALGRAAEAIAFYDRYHHQGRPAERAYALARIRALASELDDKSVLSAYESLKHDDGAGAAIVGTRVASYYAARGDTDRAEDIRDDIEDARADIGLTDFSGGSGKGNPSLVGAVLPLSGRRGRIGEVAMRGLVLAAGTFDESSGLGVARSGVPKPFALSVEDSKSQAGAAAEAVKRLADAQSIAVVGPLGGTAVDGAAAEATRHGLPLFSLDPRGKSASGAEVVYHMMHSAEDRARALARHAISKGVKDFAILRPDNGYGRAVGGAFEREVRRLGGTVVVEQTYESSATSFGKTIAKLRKPWQALFIPELASRLELIAPALAAANFISQPVGSKKPRRGRGILLLSTAESITSKYLRSSGRYSRGAVLAPGFYPDRSDQRIGPFVDRYFAAYGRLPSSLDAYAYDASLVVRGAVEAGATSRQAVMDHVSRSAVEGLTGKVGFDASKHRADDGLLFEVQDTDSTDVEIRALR